MDGFYKLKIQARNKDGTKSLVTTAFNDYSEIDGFTNEIINKVLDFAYGMSFGRDGQHRDHRTGGVHKRKNGEIFVNVFQGKLAEYALYLELKDNHDIEEPDLEMYDLGTWDETYKKFVCKP